MKTTITLLMKGEVRVRIMGDNTYPTDFHWQIQELAKNNGLTVEWIDIREEEEKK